MLATVRPRRAAPGDTEPKRAAVSRNRDMMPKQRGRLRPRSRKRPIR
ncbi:hypothetical protein C7S16_1904 [Burkholderia thailandensis]|uniref:Uncharacterized protein n=1 Tax=Burkholderia thailandensis TaxID=57975 RepID=A0AAW9D5V1_BURTH|nr:hypothetical protein [Burkholderia thailandensis]MDW9257382.1 hypothetical protein [Burkholderia thailandensis]